MLGFLIIQRNGEDANISFVTDPVICVEDFLIQSGTWKDAVYEIIPVNINTLDPVEHPKLRLIENLQFRADGFLDSEEAILESIKTRS